MAQDVDQIPASATFVLTAGLIFALKQEAARLDISVSELVRTLLTDALATAGLAA